MYKKHTIGVVVPAYEEEELIGETLSGIPDYVDKIYAVDDASTDNTAEIIKEFKNNDERIVYIRHEKNNGVGATIVSGYKKALEDGVDITAVMAGDNQMDPEQLPNLLNPIVDGKAEYTKGDRFLRKNYKLKMTLWRRFGTFFLAWLTRIGSGYWHISDPQNGYVAISSEALKKIDLDSLYNRYAFENDMLIKASMSNIKVVNVPVRIRYKIGEKSNIKYSNFIVKTSWFLLKSFLRRIWIMYLKRFHYLGFLYLCGFILILLGFLLLIFKVYELFTLGWALFIIACAIEYKLNKRRIDV